MLPIASNSSNSASLIYQRGAALLWALLLGLAALLGAALYGYYWVQQPLALPADAPAEGVYVEVPRGAGAALVARHLQQTGLPLPQLPSKLWLRLHASRFKAGTYAIEPGDSLASVTQKIVTGKQAWLRITIPEGWNLRQVRQHLRSQSSLKAESAAWTDAELAQQLGLSSEGSLEGRLAPDTYLLARGSSDVALYRMALAQMERNLAQAWASRSAHSVLKSPEEALILASIVEKESGHAADRGRVAGVFHNRLRLGMRLQTDPTVIYGMGAAYQGRIRKIDLQTDTPYNTYTRHGLPPTAIAMPGQAALLAAVQPEQTAALYFVAKGDGSGQSVFSNTLEQHNRAVRQYILRR